MVCNDVSSLLLKLGLPAYDSNSWRLFIDGSKCSLKCVLLHNTYEYGSILIGHSTTLKENYKSIKQVLRCIKYCDHNWKLCADLKMVNFLLGQQSGYTKYLWFICEWDSQDKTNHWIIREIESFETHSLWVTRMSYECRSSYEVRIYKAVTQSFGQGWRVLQIHLPFVSWTQYGETQRWNFRWTRHTQDARI